MLDIIESVPHSCNIDYVFFNTGIEYDATKKHLSYLEEKYGVNIIRKNAVKPIPVCCKQYGIPFLSKWVSEMMSRLQKHNFQWEDDTYENLSKKYPNCSVALKWWCNENGDGSRYNINRNKWLKEFIIQNHPKFKISNKCCYYAKKLVAKHLLEGGKYNLNIIGVRKAEGGIRATNYKSCFASKADSNKIYDEWRPLFWFTDKNKEDYDKSRDIVHSDCYTKYGLKRTGCVGCPYNIHFETELQVIQDHEPKFYNFVKNVFGESYEYTRAYRQFQENKKII